ncbi:GntR family transcriptional regulator [Nocardia sp. NPDC050406]|uniref:GntR family transcriptional regulator n=1 Tax=Nocardia sp. NPDC050406 TaxID=3364318 RepID=UPI0037A8A17F
MPPRPRLPRLPQLTPPHDTRRGYSQQEVLDELRRLVLEGNLPPGTGMPLGELAREFGTSAIPVRESLQTLIGEGLIEHRPNLGYRVTQLTAAELREMYVVRERLESTALLAAVSRATAEEHQVAREAHERMERAVLTENAVAYHRETRNFHLALVRPSGMPRLVHMLEYAWNITEPVQPMVHVTTADRVVLHADHRRQLDAFLARDAEALLRATEQHSARMTAILDQLPQTSGLLAPDSDGVQDI